MIHLSTLMQTADFLFTFSYYFQCIQNGGQLQLQPVCWITDEPPWLSKYTNLESRGSPPDFSFIADFSDVAATGEKYASFTLLQGCQLVTCRHRNPLSYSDYLKEFVLLPLWGSLYALWVTCVRFEYCLLALEPLHTAASPFLDITMPLDVELVPTTCRNSRGWGSSVSYSRSFIVSADCALCASLQCVQFMYDSRFFFCTRS